MATTELEVPEAVAGESGLGPKLHLGFRRARVFPHIAQMGVDGVVINRWDRASDACSRSQSTR